MKGRVLAGVLVAGLAGSAAADNWPQWRGPLLNGVSGEVNLPLRWTQQENVAWKLPLPARSGSTPIIWGDRVFLSVAEGDDISLWTVDKATGKVLWKQHLGGGNQTVRKHNMSSPSPVTDGQTVWVLTGTGVLKAFDFAGKERWARDIPKEYGAFGLNHGYGSSPLLHDGALFIPVLHGMKTDDPSYLLRIDGATGKTVWRMERPTPAIQESPDAYTTPALVKRGSQVEIVVSGGDIVTGHDPATGKELWRAHGLNPQNDPWYRIVASPVVNGDLVYAPTRVRPMLALRTGGRGDVTRSHRVWSFDNGPDVPTPVTDGTLLYVVNDKGIAWALDAATGKEVYGPERLKTGTYSSSPVLADGRIYVTNEDGVTSVYRAGPKFELLAENDLGDYTLSSLAVSEGQIFARTASGLYAIGQRR
ncbi:MAG TPA: PQQ-binding-like beta-propeller repeat protein, partial [Vicinamibacteria bacterium]|nr:PQQ-binding-like beta-propeller repeat protein [Vicinamibacteria bacterium]